MNKLNLMTPNDFDNLTSLSVLKDSLGKSVIDYEYTTGLFVPFRFKSEKYRVKCINTTGFDYSYPQLEDELNISIEKFMYLPKKEQITSFLRLVKKEASSLGIRTEENDGYMTFFFPFPVLIYFLPKNKDVSNNYKVNGIEKGAFIRSLTVKPFDTSYVSGDYGEGYIDFHIENFETL